MNLSIFNEFLSEFDKPGKIVLLEGKRIVNEADKPNLIALGKLIASESKHILFRSGNAKGADELFSQGVCEINPNRLEVMTPTKGHRKNYNQAGITHSLDEINIAEEPHLVYQSKRNKDKKGLVEQYEKGVNNKLAGQGALIIRDTLKVIGTKDIPPASFAIFYDDLSNPGTGGTGHTMLMCRNNGVLYITQKIWMKWL